MIPINLNVNENSKTYELNLQMDNRSVSLSREEHTPKYIGARAYCTPTDDGAIITLIDYNGETSVEIKNGRSQLDDNDYTKIATTVLNLLQNSLANEVFMNVREYDANRNGIVDNAESVNGYTVESNVPQNAEFTDTKYDTLTSLMIDDICDL